LKAALGRVQHLAAFAGSLVCDKRVAADDQSLAGVVLGGDLGQVRVVEQREL